MTNIKAIASRNDLADAENSLVREYRALVDDLLAAPELAQLAGFRHHKLDRRQHVLNVSWYAFLLARRCHLDSAACARCGLLHDLFFYNFSEEDCGKSEHIRNHPQQALANARALTELSPREEDIILNHMWPMSVEHCRHCKETYLVACIDKLCCLLELSAAAWRCSKRRAARAWQNVRGRN